MAALLFKTNNFWVNLVNFITKYLLICINLLTCTNHLIIYLSYNFEFDSLEYSYERKFFQQLLLPHII